MPNSSAEARTRKLDAPRLVTCWLFILRMRLLFVMGTSPRRDHEKRHRADPAAFSDEIRRLGLDGPRDEYVAAETFREPAPYADPTPVPHRIHDSEPLT